MMASRRFMMLVSIGIVVLCTGLGYLAEVLWEWPWMTGASILLTLAIMAIGAFAVMGSDHPPTWGGGFWSIYTEMSGREAAGGGLSEMTRPKGDVHSMLLLVAVSPALALVILLVLQLV